MALVQDKFELSVTLVGSNTSKKATLTYHLRGTVYADAVADAAAIITALEAVTDAEVIGYKIAEKFIEDTPSYPTGCQLVDVVVLSGKIDGDLTKSCTARVPGVIQGVPAFMQAFGDQANVADVAGHAPWANYWGVFASTGYAYISDGEDAGVLEAGHLTSRQSPNP